MSSFCYTTTVASTCGLGLFYNFTGSNNGNYTHLIRDTNFPGGIGYAVAGFIDTQACQRAYLDLAEKYEIVFQSPVKRNSNSGHDFFFCVYKKGD